MAKHSIQITDSKLYESIVEYCKENGLKVSFLCTDMLRKQFLIEKFGDIPFGNFQDSSSVSYDDKSVTSSVDTPMVVVPWVPVDSTLTVEERQKLSAEERRKLSLEGEDNSIITSPIEGRYTQKEVPDKFYSEITIDSANKTSEETQKHTEKPKKRRL